MIGPLFKWFGSKWSAAKLYPAPVHQLIIEPFAGSAGYSLRHVEHDVELWESNAQLLRLWRWLIYASTETDIRAIPIGLPIGTDIRSIGLFEGQALLLKHWQRTNNLGDCWTVSPWGNLPGQWTANTRARVAEQAQAVRHWKVIEPSWREPATYFIDPPYQYNYKYKSECDYAALAGQLQALPSGSQIIACEAVCPKSGAVPNYLPFEPFASRVTSRRKAAEHHHSKELLWHGRT